MRQHYQKEYQNDFQKIQYDNGMIIYNHPIDNNQSNLAKNQIQLTYQNSLQQQKHYYQSPQITSPKLYQSSQQQVINTKSNSQNGFLSPQKTIKNNMRNSYSLHGDNYTQNINETNRKINQIKEQKNKTLRKPFMSQYDSTNLLQQQNNEVTEKNTLPTFSRIKESQNKEQSLLLSGNKFESLNDLSKQETIKKNKQVKQLQLKENNHIQSHSFDSNRKLEQQNNGYLSMQKYKKLDLNGNSMLVNFQDYCKIKEQLHATEIENISNQDNNYYSNNLKNNLSYGQNLNNLNIQKQSTQSMNMGSSNSMNSMKKHNINETKKLQSKPSSQKEIYDFNKKMIETMQLQKEVKMVFENNQQNKVSQLLDLPYYKLQREINSIQSLRNNHQSLVNEQNEIPKQGYSSDRNKYIFSDRLQNQSVSPQQTNLKSSSLFSTLDKNQELDSQNNNINQEKINLNKIQPKINHEQKNINPLYLIQKKENLNEENKKINIIRRKSENSMNYHSQNNLISKKGLSSMSLLSSPKNSLASLGSPINSLNIQNNIINSPVSQDINQNQILKQSNNNHLPQIKQPIENIHNIQPHSVLNKEDYAMRTYSPQVKSNVKQNQKLERNRMSDTDIQQNTLLDTNSNQYKKLNSLQNTKLFYNQNSTDQKQLYFNNQIDIKEQQPQQFEKRTNQRENFIKQNAQYHSADGKQSYLSQKDTINFKQNNELSQFNNSENIQMFQQKQIDSQKWKVNQQLNQIYKSQLKNNINKIRRSTVQPQLQSQNESKLFNQTDQFGMLNSSIEKQLQQENDMDQQLDLSKNINNTKQKLSINIPPSINSYSSIENGINNSNNKEMNQETTSIQIRNIKNPLQNQEEMIQNKKLMNDPLYQDYSNSNFARSEKKKYSYNYQLQKQAIILSLGSSKLIKPQQSQQQGSQNTIEVNPNQNNKVTLRRKSSISGYFANDNNKQEKGSLQQICNSILNISTDCNKQQSTISFSQIPHRKSSIQITTQTDINDTPIRAIQSERKIQFQAQRDQQIEQIQQTRNLRQKRNSFSSVRDNQGQENQKQHFQLIPMTLIQENEDEMCSPQHNLYGMRKKNQTLCIPQLKIVESSIPSLSQLSSQNIINTCSPQIKKQLDLKEFQKHKNTIKMELTDFFNSTSPNIGHEIILCVNYCYEIAEKSTELGLSSFDKEKYITFNEDTYKKGGEQLRELLFSFNFELHQILLFQKKYNFLVSQIFRKSLLEQIQEIFPLNELIEEIIIKLSDTVTFLKKDFTDSDLREIQNGIAAVLSGHNEILIYSLEKYNKFITIEPLDFYFIKQIIFSSLRSKNYPSDIIYQVIEKIEKLRNFFFPHYQFSDSNFRKNLASLFLYNKILVGYFLDPSVQNIQDFIHSLWNCLHGFDTLDRFGEELKKCLKTQPNNKFIELLQEFILDNIYKSLSVQELDDIKLKQMFHTQLNIPTIAQIDTQSIIDTIKEITLLKAVNKQLPVEIYESKIFNTSYIELFFDLAVKTNREVISVFETALIVSPLKTDLETITYQYEILKQALNTLNLDMPLIEDISFLYQLLLIKQLTRQQSIRSQLSLNLDLQ